MIYWAKTTYVHNSTGTHARKSSARSILSFSLPCSRSPSVPRVRAPPPPRPAPAAASCLRRLRRPAPPLHHLPFRFPCCPQPQSTSLARLTLTLAAASSARRSCSPGSQASCCAAPPTKSSTSSLRSCSPSQWLPVSTTASSSTLPRPSASTPMSAAPSPPWARFTDPIFWTPAAPRDAA